MKHKYLEELGFDPLYETKKDKRNKKWAKEREKYGFDSRETWNMDITFLAWLYEHLRMYKDVNIVDLTFHKFDYNGEIVSLEDVINKILENIKFVFKDETSYFIGNNEVIAAENEIMDLFSMVWKYLWW